MEEKMKTNVLWPEPSFTVNDVDLWDAQAVREILALCGISEDGRCLIWRGDGSDPLSSLADDLPVVITAADLRSLLMMKPNVRSVIERCRNFIDTTREPKYPAGADLADEIDKLLELDEKAGVGLGLQQKLLTVFDEAAEQELKRVTSVPYNSKDVCEYFTKNVRKRILALQIPDAVAHYGGVRSDEEIFGMRSGVAGAEESPTMDDAIAAGDGTLHGAIDYWQNLATEAMDALSQQDDPCEAEDVVSRIQAMRQRSVELVQENELLAHKGQELQDKCTKMGQVLEEALSMLTSIWSGYPVTALNKRFESAVAQAALLGIETKNRSM